MITASNKKEIRLIVAEDLEITYTGSVKKIQEMTDLLFDLGAYAICTGSFKLSRQQYAEFASKSTSILYQ